MDEPGAPIRIFVAMPGTTMGDNMWSDIPEIKSNLLEPVAQGVGERLCRPTSLAIEKDKLSMGPIHRSMFRDAYDADVYIADLTGSNANVYLELGVRWALRDGVTIPITQDVSAVEFNVSGTRAIPYGQGPNVLRQAIAQIVEAAVDGLRRPDRIDSPVRDGSPTVAIERSRLDELRSEIEQLKLERADDLFDAAQEAEPASAIGLLRQAITRNPHHFAALLRLGVLLRKAGEYDESLDVLRRAVAVQSNSAEGWRELSVTSSVAGRLDDAEDAARRSLEIDPDNEEAHSNLGGIHRRRARELTNPEERLAALQQAWSCYGRAHAIDRTDTYPLINMALVDLLLPVGTDGPVDDTILRKLELLTELEVMNSPDDPWKWFDRATTLALRGITPGAEESARAALALIPSGQVGPYVASVVAPLQDSLDGASLAPAQHHAIVQVVDVLATAARGVVAAGTARTGSAE